MPDEEDKSVSDVDRFLGGDTMDLIDKDGKLVPLYEIAKREKPAAEEAS